VKAWKSTHAPKTVEYWQLLPSQGDCFMGEYIKDRRLVLGVLLLGVIAVAAVMIVFSAVSEAAARNATQTGEDPFSELPWGRREDDSTILRDASLHGRRGPIQLNRPSWYPRAMRGRVNRNASPGWKKLRHACSVRTRQHQRREVQDRQVRHRAPLKEHKRVDPCLNISHREPALHD
jgi:hypothetical protein